MKGKANLAFVDRHLRFSRFTPSVLQRRPASPTCLLCCMSLNRGIPKRFAGFGWHIFTVVRPIQIGTEQDFQYLTVVHRGYGEWLIK